MAWRIHDYVVRGEIDNRERGIVRGRIWLAGMAEPITLELQGNACADLAGCLLSFENTKEPSPVPEESAPALVQKGTIGDLTASRKVRVLEMPTGEAYLRFKKKLPVPEHIANCLYLEWFSELNGRVVVESADYKLTISAPAWRLSAEEDERRAADAALGFSGFMTKLSQALEAKKHEVPEDKEWDEFDYEKFMRECDARTDKYAELLDKYMDHPDSDRIIAKEMGWTWLEEALDAQDDEALEGQAPADQLLQGADTKADEGDEEDNEDDPFSAADDLPDPTPDPETEGIDWVRDEHGQITHPLCKRALEGSMALWHKCDGLKKSQDKDLAALIGGYQTTSAKLAGALDGLAYGRDLRDGAFVVAYLKRALSHLHGSQAALETVATKKLLSSDIITQTRAELFAIREEILRLMTEFRAEG
jgi:hypothetical protein